MGDEAAQNANVGPAGDPGASSAEVELLQSLSLLHATLESTRDGILVADFAGRVVLYNTQFLQMWGLAAEQVKGRPELEVREAVAHNFVDPDDVRRQSNASYADPEVVMTHTFTLKDGRVIERFTQPQRLGDAIIGRVGSFRDITQRVKAELALKDSAERHRLAAQMTADIIFEVDIETGDVQYHGNIEGILGYGPGEFPRRTEAWAEHLHPDDRERVLETYQAALDSEDGKYQASYRMLRPDGGIVHWTARGQIYCRPADGRRVMVGAMVNETERIQAEAERLRIEGQFRHLQKMEAIGTLAGGIAHDFNNILYGISGYGEMVRDALEPDSQAWQDQQQVLNAAQRAAELVRQILTFSRKSESKRVPVRIAPVIKEVAKLIRASLPATIEARVEIFCEDATTIADPIELHQVLMNLCTNAGHAMRESGGTLQLALREYEYQPESKQLQIVEQLQPGSYYALSVSDTGTGITREHIERLWEPYFTTKAQGEGTGLGLPTVHGIVLDLGGAINVYSEVGLGTTFQVFLPRSTESDTSAQAAAVLAGHERILFVDDEPMLATMGKRLLEQHGYQVTAFSNSIEALAELESYPGEYDLLITDDTMPGLTGRELAARAEQIRPGLPVLLCTGFSQRLDNTSIAGAIKAVLMKPLSVTELTQAIRDASAGGIRGQQE